MYGTVVGLLHCPQPAGLSCGGATTIFPPKVRYVCRDECGQRMHSDMLNPCGMKSTHTSEKRPSFFCHHHHTHTHTLSLLDECVSTELAGKRELKRRRRLTRKRGLILERVIHRHSQEVRLLSGRSSGSICITYNQV
jgi:hypothetical protein